MYIRVRLPCVSVLNAHHNYNCMKSACHIIIFLFGVLKIHAQQAQADSLAYSQSLGNTTRLYQQEVQQNLRIFTGSEYIYTGHGAKGFPFFESASLLPGDIYYNGRPYLHIPLHYDLTSGDLVVNDYTGNYSIRLAPEKVDSFFALNHKFVHLQGEAARQIASGPGFYEYLYEGKITVLVKREKRFQLSLNAADRTSSYLEFNSIYILNNGQYYPVHNKSTLLDALEDKRSLLKTFLSRSKPDFRKARENAIVQTAAYYDQIKN